MAESKMPKKIYKVLGNFIIDAENSKYFAKGSYGFIYLCRKRTEKTNDYVAKRIEKIDKNLQVIEEEKSIVKKINGCKSQYIMKCEDIIDTGKDIYFISRFCNEKDLEELCDKMFSLKMPEIKRIFSQIAIGLMDLHNENIIHRDMKPSNVFVNRNDKGELIAYIADFSFSTVLEGKLYNSTICGTELTMSPQLIQSEVSTGKVDIWAMGVILYRVVFGRYPFIGKNIHAQIVKGVYIIHMGFTVSKELLLLLESCLQYKEDDRPDATDLFNLSQFFIKEWPYQELYLVLRDFELDSRHKNITEHFELLLEGDNKRLERLNC